MSNPGFRLEMQMLPLEIIYSPICIDKISSFFSSALSSSLMDEIVIAARKQYQSGTNLWSDILLQHQSVYVNIDIHVSIYYYTYLMYLTMNIRHPRFIYLKMYVMIWNHC